jgi:hypothetical protein
VLSQNVRWWAIHVRSIIMRQYFEMGTKIQSWACLPKVNPTECSQYEKTARSRLCHHVSDTKAKGIPLKNLKPVTCNWDVTFNISCHFWIIIDVGFFSLIYRDIRDTGLGTFLMNWSARIENSGIQAFRHSGIEGMSEWGWISHLIDLVTNATQVLWQSIANISRLEQ